MSRPLTAVLGPGVDPAPDDHVLGDPAAPVTVLEYGDYECPYCADAEPIIERMLQDFGDDLRHVWRHLPLNDVHRNAQAAAEAAEAAAAQGAFWPMHGELLRDTDHRLGPADLERYAQELGLDLDRFRRALEDHDHAGRVSEDVSSADVSGVAGTPTFFINGARHQGAYDVETLTAAIRSALRREQLRRAARPAAPTDEFNAGRWSERA